MVFNLDRYDEPGSHWVSLYVSLGEPGKLKKTKTIIGGSLNASIQWEQTDPIEGSKRHKKYVESPFIFYFDSTGREAPAEITALINRIKDQCLKLPKSINIKSYNNNGKDHQKSNTECGMYSLFFIITMLTNKMENKNTPNGEIELGFNEKIALFRDATIPDKYVELYRHKYFNKPG
jgi:hypothetical protein